MGLGSSFRWTTRTAIAAAALASLMHALATEPTIEELKARVSSASVGEKPRLCVQIAQRQLTEADKSFAATNDEKGQNDLTDALSFAEQARDYAIRSHKYEKQTEIAVRGMIRKLNDILHTLPHEEQGPVKEAISRLQRVRDDLLTSMFPKGAK